MRKVIQRDKYVNQNVKGVLGIGKTEDANAVFLAKKA